MSDRCYLTWLLERSQMRWVDFLSALQNVECHFWLLLLLCDSDVQIEEACSIEVDAQVVDDVNVDLSKVQVRCP